MKKITILSFIFVYLLASCNSSGGNTSLKNTRPNDSILTDSVAIVPQTVDTSRVSLLFLGDIMQHDLQIQSAYDKTLNVYDFSTQFEYVKPIFDSTDIVIGNLEVTFGGPPYKGYPKFSSPNALAYNIKKAGINYLVTANNHIYDKGKAGFEKTLNLLDSVGFSRTGAYLNQEDKKKNHPMIINKNNFKIAVFNYTYALNDGIKHEKPSIVSLLNPDSVKSDLQKASKKNYDAVVVYFHWGEEYKRQPNQEQINLTKICFENGANIVIGAHPHVINRMEQYKYTTKNGQNKDVLVAYSLGNFVSNYGTWRYCDGGAMIKFTLTKTSKNTEVKINNSEHILIWVYRPVREGKYRNYYVIPVTQFEDGKNLEAAHFKQMKTFINDSRTLLKNQNVNVPEWRYKPKTD